MPSLQDRIERDAAMLGDGANRDVQTALAAVVLNARSVTMERKPNRPIGQVIALAVLFIVYFPTALYLQTLYVPSDGSVMKRPFKHLSGNSYSSFHWLRGSIGDSPEFPQRSTLDLYEDDKKLGPEHAPHHKITTDGRGAYSQWFTGHEGYIIIFSTSDNSDPNTNGRSYRAKAR